MWPFKKKIQKPKVYCSECKFYRYYDAPGHFHDRDDCLVHNETPERIQVDDTPIYRAHTYIKNGSIENARIKNLHNDCPDYKTIFPDLGEDL